jgi:methionyl aminopeptidase
MAIPLKSPEEIQRMARAGALLWSLLQRAAELARPGITTGQLDAWLHDQIRSAGAVPIMHGYRGQRGEALPFPAAAAICINEEVVHAIPGPRLLRPGDIVTLDCALSLDGWCADAALTVLLGESDPQRTRLAQAAREVLAAAIEAIRPGRPWSQVAVAAGGTAQQAGFELLGDFAGHGIGRSLHEPPAAAFESPEHPAAAARLDFILRPGMAFTIEPVLVPGRAGVLALEDGWTVLTADRAPAAHEERTVAVTRTGVRILTV